MQTPPLDLRNFGVEEIEVSPLHLHWLTPLGLRRHLMRVREQMAILSMINRLGEHVRAIIRIGDLVEAHLVQIDAFAYHRRAAVSSLHDGGLEIESRTPFHFKQNKLDDGLLKNARLTQSLISNY